MRQIGRMTGCISTPTSSSRPKPTRKASATAPSGTIRPTVSASLSNRKGSMSFSNSGAGPSFNRYISASTRPRTLSTLNTAAVVLVRQLPLTKGAAAPQAMSASTSAIDRLRCCWAR
ncbi:hypothetical protein FQZ97_972060 [compost metagenome]